MVYVLLKASLDENGVHLITTEKVMYLQSSLLFVAS